MIMSPFVLDKNVPLIRPPKGGRIEADRNEQEGARTGGGVSTGTKQAAAVGGRGAADACLLPPSETVVEAVSGGRRRGLEARQCWTTLAPAEVPAESPSAGAREVRWAGGRAIWPDAGGGALGLGGWVAGGRRNAATLDAGRGVMEPRAKATSASSATGAQGALWGDGADGRELSRVAGGARTRGLLDR